MSIQTIDEMESSIEILRSALIESRGRFQSYADQHHAKQTAEGSLKAMTNERFVAMIDAALAKVPTPHPEKED